MEEQKLLPRELWENCPNCPNQGWYAERDKEGDAVQFECEYCKTVEASDFNQTEKVIERLSALEAKNAELNKTAELLTKNCIGWQERAMRAEAQLSAQWERLVGYVDKLPDAPNVDGSVNVTIYGKPFDENAVALFSREGEL